MSIPTDDMLTERRVRSSELALEAARRQLAESKEELAEARSKIAELQTSATIVNLGPIAQLKAELAEETRARRVAEQSLQAERDHRDMLVRELARRSAPAIEGVERELLVAQKQAESLEAELEVVRRHSAEFEQGIRLAIGGAWEWLGDVRQRVNGSLLELQQLRGAGVRPGGRQDDLGEPVRSRRSPVDTYGRDDRSHPERARRSTTGVGEPSSRTGDVRSSTGSPPEVNRSPSADSVPLAGVSPSADPVPLADLPPSADWEPSADVSPPADGRPEADISPSDGTSAESDISPERLDRALARLRAYEPPGPPPAQLEYGPPPHHRRRWRWLTGRSPKR